MQKFFEIVLLSTIVCDDLDHILHILAPVNLVTSVTIVLVMTELNAYFGDFTRSFT